LHHGICKSEIEEYNCFKVKPENETRNCYVNGIGLSIDWPSHLINTLNVTLKINNPLRVLLEMTIVYKQELTLAIVKRTLRSN
jgi:hypothetical protein